MSTSFNVNDANDPMHFVHCFDAYRLGGVKREKVTTKRPSSSPYFQCSFIHEGATMAKCLAGTEH